MTAHLGETELARMRRGGAHALSVEEGLALFSAALDRPETQLAPVKLDLATLARQDDVPPLLRSLVRPRLRQVANGPSESPDFLEGLALLDEKERAEALTDFVRGEVAAVVGLPGAGVVGAEKPLQELGLDSLMSVDLKNRLAAQTGATLPNTLAFDYPTPRAIAEFLLSRLKFDTDSQDGPPQDPAAAARWAIGKVSPELLRQSGLLAQLINLAEGGDPGRQRAADEALQAAEELSDSEIDKALDDVLGDFTV